MPKRNIALFVDIYPPSMGGGASRALCIVQGLIAMNYNVTVVTTGCTYPIGKSIFISKIAKEEHPCLKIVRVQSLNLPFKGLINRILNYFSSAFFMFLYSSSLRKTDFVYSIGMHPFTDISAYLVKLTNHQCKLIFDISDIFPEKSLYNLMNHPVNRFLTHISDFAVVHNNRLKKIFTQRYAYRKKIAIVPNSVDTAVFKLNETGGKKELNQLCKRSVDGKFVVCYFGVFGFYQGLENVIKAASVLEKNSEIIFCIIGDGEEREKLENLSRNLSNTFLLPKLPREQIARIAREVDLGLAPVVIDDKLVNFVNLPSKAAEFLSCGVPILVSKGSFIGHLVSETDTGREVNFKDIEDICRSIMYLYDNRDKLREMSKRARSLALTHFSIATVKASLSYVMGGYVE